MWTAGSAAPPETAHRASPGAGGLIKLRSCCSSAKQKQLQFPKRDEGPFLWIVGSQGQPGPCRFTACHCSISLTGHGYCPCPCRPLQGQDGSVAAGAPVHSGAEPLQAGARPGGVRGLARPVGAASPTRPLTVRRGGSTGSRDGSPARVVGLFKGEPWLGLARGAVAEASLVSQLAATGLWLGCGVLCWEGCCNAACCADRCLQRIKCMTMNPPFRCTSSHSLPVISTDPASQPQAPPSHSQHHAPHPIITATHPPTRPPTPTFTSSPGHAGVPDGALG